MSTEGEVNESGSSSYWTKKEISLKDIAVSLAIAFSVASLSSVLSEVISALIPTSNMILKMANSIFGNMYLIMTTLM